jgi:mannitol-1-phosphate 5-dehydrogenase
MGKPRCLVVGAGRIAGGFISPVLSASGWDVALACRTRDIATAINRHGGLLVRTVGTPPGEAWITGLTALPLDNGLHRAVVEADLIATAVGPSALPGVGRLLGPMLSARFASTGRPVNVIAFENHRSTQELLASGLFHAQPALASEIGRRLGISGAAVWRTVSRRHVGEAGLVFDANAVDECFVDAVSLVAGAAPANHAIPGLTLVRAFDDRMVEKLWLYNAGHAAAAFLGWQAGCATVHEALADARIRAATAAVVGEAQQGFDAYLGGRPGSIAVPHRSVESILNHYAEPALQDAVVRVAREPRRKLAAGDRFVGPAVACLSAGLRPAAIAGAAASALAYAEPSDPQALDLQREIRLLGPREVLAAISTLDPRDDLVDLVCERFGARGHDSKSAVVTHGERHTR